MILTLIVTVLFMNGEKLGITKIVDEDSEYADETILFTDNDNAGDWGRSLATKINLDAKENYEASDKAYFLDGNLYINQAGYYALSGDMPGSVIVEADKNAKVFIALDGVNIDGQDDAAIKVLKADKVFLSLGDGTINTLTGDSEYSDDAVDGVIYAKEDLTINGSGSLSIVAKYKHGIAANDDLVITGGNITIDANLDAIHVNDHFKFREATLPIATKDDAIHCDKEISVVSGDITIHSCYEGIEAHDINIEGGDIVIYASDDGINANGGDGGFGNFGGNFGGPGNFGGGSFPGGNFGGFNGNFNPNEGDRNTEEFNFERPNRDNENENGERPKREGMPQGGSFPGNGEMPDMGSFPNMGEAPNMSNYPDMGEAPDMSDFPNMGELPDTSNIPYRENRPERDNVAEFDKEAFNDQSSKADTDTEASEDEEAPTVRISGGSVKIYNSNGMDADGIDSNGDIIITGGYVFVSLIGNGVNCALDYGSESGGKLIIDGGTVIAAGGSGMLESVSSESKQASGIFKPKTRTGSDSSLVIKDSQNNIIIDTIIPYEYSALIFSTPEMNQNDTLTFTVNGIVE